MNIGSLVTSNKNTHISMSMVLFWFWHWPQYKAQKCWSPLLYLLKTSRPVCEFICELWYHESGKQFLNWNFSHKDRRGLPGLAYALIQCGRLCCSSSLPFHTPCTFFLFPWSCQGLSSHWTSSETLHFDLSLQGIALVQDQRFYWQCQKGKRHPHWNF